MTIDRARSVLVEVSKNVLPVFDVSPKTLKLYNGTKLAPTEGKSRSPQSRGDEPLNPMVPLRSVSYYNEMREQSVRYTIFIQVVGHFIRKRRGDLRKCS